MTRSRIATTEMMGIQMAARFLINAIAITVFLAAQPASANLVLNFSGTTGSSTVSWEASGSITITQATDSFSSGVGAAPVGGEWDTAYDNNLGDLIQDDQSTQLNLSLGSGISYQFNSSQFGVFDTIDLNATNGAGGDDIQPDPTSTISYPTLVIGDVVSWTGSGTFTLGGTTTYDSFFVGGSIGSSTIDGGQYIVNISPAAVPEPPTLAMFAIAMAGTGYRRRR